MHFSNLKQRNIVNLSMLLVIPLCLWDKHTLLLWLYENGLNQQLFWRKIYWNYFSKFLKKKIKKKKGMPSGINWGWYQYFSFQLFSDWVFECTYLVFELIGIWSVSLDLYWKFLAGGGCNFILNNFGYSTAKSFFNGS